MSSDLGGEAGVGTAASVGYNGTMASRRSALASQNEISGNDPLRELFEACRNGDLVRVKKLVTPQNVNARDTAGRKSSPLHFAAGEWLPAAAAPGLAGLGAFWYFHPTYRGSALLSCYPGTAGPTTSAWPGGRASPVLCWRAVQRKGEWPAAVLSSAAFVASPQHS